MYGFVRTAGSNPALSASIAAAAIDGARGSRLNGGLWRSLVSAPDWGSGGRRFKSAQPDWNAPSEAWGRGEAGGNPGEPPEACGPGKSTNLHPQLGGGYVPQIPVLRHFPVFPVDRPLPVDHPALNRKRLGRFWLGRERTKDRFHPSCGRFCRRSLVSTATSAGPVSIPRPFRVEDSRVSKNGRECRVPDCVWNP